MKDEIKKNKFGFTLVELIVSIAVITIISTMALVNFKGHDKKTKVDLAAYKLASDIRRAQSFALSMKEYGGAVPAGGWGVYFFKGTDNQYIVFADLGAKNYFHDNTDGDYQVVKFDDDIIIDQLVCSGATSGSDNGSKNKSAIVYEPPNPDGFITGNNAGQNTATILEITLKSGTNIKKVKVNKFGLVDVE